MAFVASHPSFPQGSWPSWDVRIAIEGLFIESWLDKTEETEIGGVMMLHKSSFVKWYPFITHVRWNSLNVVFCYNLLQSFAHMNI